MIPELGTSKAPKGSYIVAEKAQDKLGSSSHGSWDPCVYVVFWGFYKLGVLFVGFLSQEHYWATDLWKINPISLDGQYFVAPKATPSHSCNRRGVPGHHNMPYTMTIHSILFDISASSCFYNVVFWEPMSGVPDLAQLEASLPEADVDLVMELHPRVQVAGLPGVAEISGIEQGLGAMI